MSVPAAEVSESHRPTDGREPDVVRITEARAYSYRAPRANSAQSRPINYVVLLRGQGEGGADVNGIGESQPRSWKTGDDAGDSWVFLRAVLETLQGAQLRTASPEDSLASVGRLLAEISALAPAHATDEGAPNPFRGTLLGIEVALLDLVAKSHGLPLVDLLGRQRDKAPLAPPMVSPRAKFPALRKKLARQGGAYQFARLNPASGVDSTIDFMELVATINRRRRINQPAKPLWVDFNGAYTFEEAHTLVAEVVRTAAANQLPSTILLEQPVGANSGELLPRLQDEIDTAVAETGRADLDIRVVADESVWDAESVRALQEIGSVRAINIRPAQAGGLLASLEMVEQVLQRDPDALIFVSRMLGASRITASALRHLALAMPKVDGAMVASVVEGTLNMSEYVKTPEELAEEDRLAEEEAFQEKVQDSDSNFNSPVELIHSVSDDEPDSDDGDEDEVEPTHGDQREESEGSGTSGTRHEDYGWDDEKGEDEAEEPDEQDRLRGFRVKDVPGIGVRLLFSGLISDARASLIFPVPPAHTFEGQSVTTYDDVDDLHPLGPNGSKGHLLEREALALGLNTVRYSKGAFIATDGEHEAISFKWSRNPVSSAASLSLCTHKEATRMQLQRHGVPVPQGRTFASGEFAIAKQFVDRIGYPVVVKPAMGVRGIGVVAGIQDEEQLDAAFEIMGSSKLGKQDFIVEKHVMGRDYRILVVGDEVVAAILREPASVVGDGRSTIAELLINKNIARRRNPHLWARPAKYDAAAHHELRKAGRTLESILPEGEQQLLANTCSLSQGGDSIDVLDQMHPTIKEACVKAVNAMPDLEYCGVDFLLEDHSKPLDEQDAGICELNAHAAIGNCEYPMFGTPRKVAAKLMRTCVDSYGFNVPDQPSEELSLHLTIRGRVTRVGFRKWLQRRAQTSGVQGWVKNVDSKTVEAVIVGPTAPATAVAAATVLGPKRALPTSYTAVHIDPPEYVAGFQVIEDAPGEVTEVQDAPEAAAENVRG